MNKLRLLVVVLVTVCAPLAQAAIVISYKVDGGATVVCSNPSGLTVTCPTVLGPALAITTLTATSDTPGEPGLSYATSSTGGIVNTTAISHFIDILVTAQYFTTPVTPPDVTLMSNIGGTVFRGSAVNVLTFQSCVKNGSVVPACPGTFNSAVGSPAITAFGAFSDSETSTIVAGLSAPFEIGEVIHLKLGAHSNVNFAGSTTLTQVAVPEPMSIGLLGGVLLLTTRLIRRRASRA